MRARSFLLLVATGLLVALPSSTAVAGNPCFRPDHWPTTPSFEASTDISLDQCAFKPTVAQVDPGATVTFRNLDPRMEHTVTGVGQTILGPEPWSGESRKWTAPTEPGIYPFACNLHPGMVGAIVVGDGDADTEGVAAALASPPGPTTASSPPAWLYLTAAATLLAALVGTWALSTRRSHPAQRLTTGA